jgi:hypothetical protein
MTMQEPGHGIVGREGELARVRSFVGSVSEGPSALLLEGAAGIGKTTVARAGVSVARVRGHRVLACRAAESEARLSYAALGDLFDFELPISLPRSSVPRTRRSSEPRSRVLPRTSEPCRTTRLLRDRTEGGLTHPILRRLHHISGSVGGGGPARARPGRPGRGGRAAGADAARGWRRAPATKRRGGRVPLRRRRRDTRDGPAGSVDRHGPPWSRRGPPSMSTLPGWESTVVISPSPRSTREPPWTGCG